MGTTNSGSAGGLDVRRYQGHLTRRAPIWQGQLLRIWDRNFTVSTDPATQEDAASVRLWAQAHPEDAIWLARARSPEGPADALQQALRAILQQGSWRLPEIAIDGVPSGGLIHPEEGTRSEAYVRVRFRIGDTEPMAIETRFHDHATALFLAYCTAYDAAIVTQWEVNLRRAGMTIHDALPLMVPIAERVLVSAVR